MFLRLHVGSIIRCWVCFNVCQTCWIWRCCEFERSNSGVDSFRELPLWNRVRSERESTTQFSLRKEDFQQLTTWDFARVRKSITGSIVYIHVELKSLNYSCAYLWICHKILAKPKQHLSSHARKRSIHTDVVSIQAVCLHLSLNFYHVRDSDDEIYTNILRPVNWDVQVTVPAGQTVWKRCPNSSLQKRKTKIKFFEKGSKALASTWATWEIIWQRNRECANFVPDFQLQIVFSPVSLCVGLPWVQFEWKL